MAHKEVLGLIDKLIQLYTFNICSFLSYVNNNETKGRHHLDPLTYKLLNK